MRINCVCPASLQRFAVELEYNGRIARVKHVRRDPYEIDEDELVVWAVMPADIYAVVARRKTEHYVYYEKPLDPIPWLWSRAHDNEQ